MNLDISDSRGGWEVYIVHCRLYTSYIPQLSGWDTWYSCRGRTGHLPCASGGHWTCYRPWHPVDKRQYNTLQGLIQIHHIKVSFNEVSNSFFSLLLSNTLCHISIHSFLDSSNPPSSHSPKSPGPRLPNLLFSSSPAPLLPYISSPAPSFNLLSLLSPSFPFPFFLSLLLPSGSKWAAQIESDEKYQSSTPGIWSEENQKSPHCWSETKNNKKKVIV